MVLKLKGMSCGEERKVLDLPKLEESEIKSDIITISKFLPWGATVMLIQTGSFKSRGTTTNTIGN